MLRQPFSEEIVQCAWKKFSAPTRLHSEPPQLPAFDFDADPDPAFDFDSDPDPAIHFDADPIADPDPQHSL